MSRFATAFSKSHRGSRCQEGQTLMATMGVITVLAVLVGGGLRMSSTTKTASKRDARSEVALQAADAAVQRYVSRLVEDPFYYIHFVDEAEDPRTNSSGAAVPKDPPPATSTAWDNSSNWTYSGPVTGWKTLRTGGGYGLVDYSMRIKVSGDTVTVTATGRVGSDKPNPLRRSIEVRVRPSSIADFQRISDHAMAYGSDAITTGKIYSNETIAHAGIARGEAYARQHLCVSGSCSTSNVDPAHYQAGGWDSQTPETFDQKFKTPLDFTKFTRSLNAIEDAARSGTGTFYKNDPTAFGWLVQFLSTGKVRIWKITSANGGQQLGASMGNLDCGTLLDMPANGAMYFEQSVVVSDASMRRDCAGVGPAVLRNSVVDGRVTIGTKGTLYLGGNIDYETAGDDVLGMVTSAGMIVSRYAPDPTNIRGAIISQSSDWHTFDTDGSKGQLNMMVSLATFFGGYATMYRNRLYEYDETLKFLRPPLYPILEDSWENAYWREITPLA